MWLNTAVLDRLRRAALDVHHRTVRMPRTARVAGALARQIGRASSLLDVGSGEGSVAREVAERVGAARVVGVDVLVQPEASFEVVPYDGRSLPFETGAFDAITIADVLHHAEDPRALLAECLRVARDVVAVKDHFQFGPWSAGMLHLMDRVGNARHGIEVRGRYFSPATFCELVEAAGGRIRQLEWPLQVHGMPYRLVTGDRVQFAARVVRGGAS